MKYILSLLSSVLMLVMFTLAAATPATALVPFSESNFYNAKCDTIAVVNSSCTVQSMNPGSGFTPSCGKDEEQVVVGNEYKCKPK